ncbi:hypothetical protein [Elizabethkingia meningoseptica]|uniref:hypothetical protein n=1 Tax=Elizabethkingia meningoseptica TaxID=238 RepID=UPI0008A95148|nr:hypothetical protein [Elizabethkingia meningoseptica]OPB71135.1 hypothetical protein BAY31_13395 [Elizabethkingia meningoseptica]
MRFNQILKANAVAIAAVIFSGAVMSFKVMEKKAADQTFYYISEDMNEGAFHNTANWTNSASGSAGCVTSGDRPCKVIVPEGSSLSSVLGSKTNSQVLGIAVQRKLAP